MWGLTDKDVEADGCCLPSAGLVLPLELDDITRLYHLVVVLLEVGED